MNIRGVHLSLRIVGIVRVFLAVLIFYILRLTIMLQTFTENVTHQMAPPGWEKLDTAQDGFHPMDAQLLYYWKHNSAERKVDVVNCRAIIEGDPKEIQEAKEYSKNHPRRSIPDKRYIELTQNCTEYKSKRGYILDSLSKEEEEFPIAYSILFYKDLQVLDRLLRAIYRPQNIYCLHLDRKSSDILYLAAQSLVRCFDNVFLASKLERIVYAGYSRLQADINCMEDVLKRQGNWKYYINLASQNFPLKTNLELVKVLKVYNGSNDIEGMGDNRLLKSRFSKVWETVTSRPRGKPFINRTSAVKTGPPYNISIVRGSAYGVFSRNFVDFIVNDKRSKALLGWSRDTYSPDEHFWATLNHLKKNPHLKTPGGFTGDPEKKQWLAVYAAWGRPSFDPCYSGKFVRGVCIFGIEDFPALLDRKELFANKFYPSYERLALDCLEEWLYNVTRTPLPFNTVFYRKLPFINGPILAQPTKKPKKVKDKPKQSKDILKDKHPKLSNNAKKGKLN